MTRSDSGQLQAQDWICVTCGVAYPEAHNPPPVCPVCEDDRQYVPATGQAWTTMDQLRQAHSNTLIAEEPGLWSIRTEPSFGIGQRAFLVQTAEGNLLWDSVSLVDAKTVRGIEDLGGIRAIAVSHPHYYSSMAEWSAAFGGVSIWIHAADQKWIMKPAEGLRFWTGERTDLFGGITLLRCGGHFDGYQVAVWPAGAEGKGVLLAGDQPQVCLDGKWVTFMYSYPNWIPLGAAQVTRIVDRLQSVVFDRLYGAFGRHLKSGAKDTVERSAGRYLRAIAD